MKYIFLHGLGQTAQSWQEVIRQLNPEWDVLCTDLAEWLLGKEACYRTLYQKLEEYCGQLEESLCLCGLSLGGILALDFAANHPDRVCRLVLMGTPYKMPRKLLKLQDVLFHFMPERAFLDIGFEKKAFIGLCRSMAALDFEKRLNRIAARTLVLCGKKDFANKAACVKLAETLPDAGLVWIPDAGHEVNRDNPVFLGKELRRFLESGQPSFLHQKGDVR